MTSATKHMSITILDQGDNARVIIHMQGPHVREYVRSGEWAKEQAELMERMQSFAAISGQLKNDTVRVELLLPKDAFVQGISLADVAEHLLGAVLQKGWKSDRVITQDNNSSVKFSLSS